MSGAPSFADLAEQHRRRQTDLDRIAELINWAPIEYRLIKRVKRDGRPPYPPLLMFRALLLGTWYSLSERSLEEALLDRASFRRFCGLGALDAVPDHSTLCSFRGRLIEHGLHTKLLGIVNEQLEASGFLVKAGTMIDATVVGAAVRPSGDAQAPSDPDAAFLKQQGKPDLNFGYKAHVAADQHSMLVREARMTPANVAETVVADDLIRACADAPAVYADKAYDSHARRALLTELGLTNAIMTRGNKHHRMSAEQIARNKAIAFDRGRIETVFAVFKQAYRLRRVRYVGLAKAQFQLTLTAIAFNLRRALRLDTVRSLPAI
jgi:transposase, IS5 family